MSSLDLKFVIHFGSFIVQHVGSYDELLGSDVNLVHRLLKDTVTERLGVLAYCLYTEQCWRQLGLQDVTSLEEHDEDIPDFGLVTTYSQDLGEVYQRTELPDITLDDSKMLLTQEADLPMSPAMVWDYLSSPTFRKILIGAERVEISDRVGGRVDVGTVFQCYHGNRLTPQKILQWEPFTKVVTRTPFPSLWREVGSLSPASKRHHQAPTSHGNGGL